MWMFGLLAEIVYDVSPHNYPCPNNSCGAVVPQSRPREVAPVLAMLRKGFNPGFCTENGSPCASGCTATSHASRKPHAADHLPTVATDLLPEKNVKIAPRENLFHRYSWQSAVFTETVIVEVFP